MERQLTTEEKKIMEHALGINREATPHRNYFLAGPDHEHYDLLNKMCIKGLMKRRLAMNWVNGDSVFVVTQKGKELLGVNQ